MTKTFNLCGYQVSFKSQAQSSHQQHSNDAPPHSRTNPPVGDQPGLLPSWQGPSPQAPCLQVRYHLHLIIIKGTSFSGEISLVLLTPYPTTCMQFSVSGIKKGRDKTKSKHPYPSLHSPRKSVFWTNNDSFLVGFSVQGPQFLGVTIFILLFFVIHFNIPGGTNPYLGS